MLCMQLNPAARPASHQSRACPPTLPRQPARQARAHLPTTSVSACLMTGPCMGAICDTGSGSAAGSPGPTPSVSSCTTSARRRMGLSTEASADTPSCLTVMFSRSSAAAGAGRVCGAGRWVSGRVRDRARQAWG